MTAGIGPRPMISGPDRGDRGGDDPRPRLEARAPSPSRRDITSTAAAPSLSGHELPAVTVPFSGSKTGLSSASFSIVVPGRGPSSRVTVADAGRSRRRSGPLSRAATARSCEISAHSSCASRRDLAALGDVLGRQPHRDVDVVRRAVGAVELRVRVERRLRREARDGLDAGGDVLVALAGLDRVEGHPDRLQRRGAEAVDRAWPGRDGRARPAARRCGRRCSPPRRARSRSPSSRRRSRAKSTPGLRSTSAFSGTAARSSARTSLSDPLAARPIGVRTASTMTASGMRSQSSSGRTRRHVERPGVCGRSAERAPASAACAATRRRSRRSRAPTAPAGRRTARPRGPRGPRR